MAWTTPKTFVATDVLTASEMNTYVRDNTAALAARAYFIPLTTPLTSTSWDGDARSTTAKTKIDLSAVFGAPAGVKAVLVIIWIRDSASSSNDTWFLLSPNDIAMEGLSLTGHPTNDRWQRQAFVVPCDANGDVYYQLNASGAKTMDVYLEIWGYWL